MPYWIRNIMHQGRHFFKFIYLKFVQNLNIATCWTELGIRCCGTRPKRVLLSKRFDDCGEEKLPLTGRNLRQSQAQGEWPTASTRWGDGTKVFFSISQVIVDFKVFPFWVSNWTWWGLFIVCVLASDENMLGAAPEVSISWQQRNGVDRLTKNYFKPQNSARTKKYWPSIYFG